MDDIQNWRYEQEQEFQRFGSAANDTGDQARNQQHGQIVPQQKRLAQLQVAIQNVTQEHTQRNAALNEMRHRYKAETAA